MGKFNRFTTLSVILIGLTLTGDSSALAEFIIEEATQYFDVGGDIPSEILAEISARRGGNIVALTKTNHEVRYSVESIGDRCKVIDTVINTQIIYLVPRWTEYQTARPEMKKAWDRFFRAIIVHENGHGDLAKAASRDLSRSIGQAKGHCSAIKTLVAGRQNIVVSRYDLRNQAYDKRTMHGQKQGIVFPEVLE